MRLRRNGMETCREGPKIDRNEEFGIQGTAIEQNKKKKKKKLFFKNEILVKTSNHLLVCRLCAILVN